MNNCRDYKKKSEIRKKNQGDLEILIKAGILPSYLGKLTSLLFFVSLNVKYFALKGILLFGLIRLRPSLPSFFSPK